MACDQLIAFYDPPSRRMKAAFVRPYTSQYRHSLLYHRGRCYENVDANIGMDEVSVIHSKQGGIIGFGYFSLAAFLDAQSPEYRFRPAVNARNAVLMESSWGRNDLAPNRDTFAEVQVAIQAGGGPWNVGYWYLTETWEEFGKQVRVRRDDERDIDWYWPLCGSHTPGSLYIWEGVSDEGEPEGDCIIELEELKRRYMCLEFELATENIPRRINASGIPALPSPPETS
ncbi:MAG: hypothetical protein M2R45_04182 [Verrucomicrobia subdivision 3 bacterium]|nr:hypothetical protein [Limisphaerales bacterium]